MAQGNKDDQGGGGQAQQRGHWIRERLKRRALVWWYGGQDRTQALRHNLGIHEEAEKFAKPEVPNYSISRKLVGWLGRSWWQVVLAIAAIVVASPLTNGGSGG